MFPIEVLDFLDGQAVEFRIDIPSLSLLVVAPHPEKQSDRTDQNGRRGGEIESVSDMEVGSVEG